MDPVIDPGLSAKWLILSALMHSGRAVGKVRDSVDEMDLFESAAKKDQGLIWTILSEYVQKYKDPPPLDVYRHRLNKELEDIQIVNREFHFDTAVDEIKKILEQESDATDYYVDVILSIYEQWVSREISTQGEFGNWSQVEELIKRGRTAHLPKEEILLNPFAGHPDDFYFEAKREPTGVPPLDWLTAGGPLEGESALFIMPTGTGKTTMAVQLSEALVNNQIPHVYVSLEQRLKKDLSMRFYIRATHSGRSYWDKLSCASEVFETYPWIKEKYEDVKEEWLKYLCLVDCWSKHEVALNSVSDLFSPVYTLAEKYGIKPQYLILDWWGLVVPKIASAKGIKEDNQTSAQKKWASEIHQNTEEAVDQGIPLRTIVFHQAAGAVVKNNSPGKPISVQSGAGNTDLANLFQWGAAASNPDENKVFLLNANKTRGGEGGVTEFKLYGEQCKIDKPSGAESRMRKEDREDNERTGTKTVAHRKRSAKL